ncbi:MAG TPA: ABC transporter ATP-binding protein [Acidimicrobiia bacterium]|jgi:NitT/TauT family transport system ATP-binding protein
MGIELRNLGKTFHSDAIDVEALADISLTVGESQFVSIIGPSGCGKSTLLRILAGLLPPTKGTVEVDGVEVTEPLGNVGFVFQAPTLFKWRTILGNVMFPYEALAGRGEADGDKASYEQRARHMLEMAGIAEFADAHPKQLSGGMQQRAAICRALVHDPAILLMDEPFGALDEFTRERMNLELLRIWDDSRKTVVFVTHHIPEAVFLSDRVIVMSPRPGRVIGDVEVGFARPRQPALRDDISFLEKVIEIRKMIWFDAASME